MQQQELFLDIQVNSKYAIKRITVTVFYNLVGVRAKSVVGLKSQDPEFHC